MLICTDIDSGNLGATPNIDDGDLMLDADGGTFFDAAGRGVQECDCIYCKHADHAIPGGYSPDTKLALELRGTVGGKRFFRYTIREKSG